MSTMIEAVFEKGVFRPLKPVAIPENQRIQIQYEFDESIESQTTTHPRLKPGEFPVDLAIELDSDIDYRPVPPKSVMTVSASFVFAGKREPATFPEE